MKVFQIVPIAILTAAVFVTSNAQTGVPVSQSKIAVVNTDAFANPKTGITRLTKAFTTLDTEFKPQRDELTTLKARYDQLIKEINTPATDRKLIASKSEQAQNLQTEIKRKQEDGRVAYERRAEALLRPVNTAIFTALNEYAKQQKIDVVFDSAKLAGVMLVTNNAVDITGAFIKDYNSRNP